MIRMEYTKQVDESNSVPKCGSLCGYSDAYILEKGDIKVIGSGSDAASRQADERNEQVIFKNCASFTNCISQRNSTQVDTAI